MSPSYCASLPLIVALLASTLCNCSSLPASGPSPASVENNASLKLTSSDRQAHLDYVLVDLTGDVPFFFEQPVHSSLLTSFAESPKGAPDIPLGYGDTVQVSVFESQSGGLFIPGDAGSRPGNYITLPPQTIDRNGTINIPYAGDIVVAGRAKDAVEHDIQRRLERRAIEPQVVLSMIASRSSQVSVLGDVNLPQKIMLGPSGERVLDALSQSGGLKTNAAETNITLERKGRTATIAYRALLARPAENLFLQPGDTLVVDHQRRTFTAFGATGENGQFDFGDTDLTLADGLAKAGGLLDGRADPKHVLLYRMTERAKLSASGVDVSRFQTATVPVVFRLDLRTPSGFFASQKFALQDKDVLYVSDAASVELVKFLGLASALTSTVGGTASDIAITRSGFRRLH